MLASCSRSSKRQERRGRREPPRSELRHGGGPQRERALAPLPKLKRMRRYEFHGPYDRSVLLDKQREVEKGCLGTKSKRMIGS